MDVPCFQRCLIFFLPTSRLLSPYCGLHIVLRVVRLPGGLCQSVTPWPNRPPDTASQDLEHVALRHKGSPKTVEKRLLSEEWGLRFYGYLDGSYTQNFNNPPIESISFAFSTSIPMSFGRISRSLCWRKKRRPRELGKIVPAFG